MQTNSPQARLQRRRRAMGWSLALVLVLSMALPLGAHWLLDDALAQQSGQPFAEGQATNPRSDTWRFARADGEGFTTSTGPYTTNTLISNIGQNWRQLRNGPVSTYGSYVMGAALLLTALFFVIRGRIRIEGGRSGMVVPRWNAFERSIHWLTATSFIILAITGLSLLFGRNVLIPLLGAGGFASYAQGARVVHNYLGPAFGVFLVVMLLMWVRHNIPNRADWKWFRMGGGLVGRGHPPAGKANGGEKVWFWLGVFLMGLTVVATGLILGQPQFGQSREIMAWSNIIHASVGMLWIAFAFGHIYIGTLGTEGALEGMTRGKVDVNWARQHHDLWYEQLQAKGVKAMPADSGGARQGAPETATPSSGAA